MKDKSFIFLDFETAWSSKDYTLSKMGPIEYVRDPRFEAQLLGVKVNDGPCKVLQGKQITDFLGSVDWSRRDIVVVGHNLHGFDALVLSEIYGVRPYYMVDTLCLARKAGIARFQSCSHKALTDYLANGTKTDGTVISDGKHWPHDFTPWEREQFIAYCRDDVEQCAKNFNSMRAYLDETELEFQSLTARMVTNPMLVIDREKMQAFIDELDAETEATREKVMEFFHFADREEFLKNIRSAAKFRTMLQVFGSDAPMKVSEKKTAAAKEKLEKMAAQGIADAAAMLADPESYTVYTPALSKTDLPFLDMLDDPDPRVACLVQARLDTNSSIHRSRAARFLELSTDGRPLPIMLQCYKAHTGRYAAGNAEGKSDAINFQNLSKRNPKHKAIRRAIHAPKGYVFVSCDSSQIEARVVAYMANQYDLLRAFAHKEDPYSQLAERMCGIPWEEIRDGAKRGDPVCKKWRDTGKTGILSAGFGVGAQKFSDTLWRQGIRLSQDHAKHEALARQAHDIYRQTNANIVAFWKLAQQVIQHLDHGGHGLFGGPNGDLFEYDRMPVVNPYSRYPSVKLPSGYMLRYPNLRSQQDERGKFEYVYDSWQGRSMLTTRIYGGYFTENLTQATAFFLLIDQAVAMAKRDVPLIGNIHDAWVACVPESEAEATKVIMMDCMSQVPPYLAGLPVACEAEIGVDYTVA